MGQTTQLMSNFGSKDRTVRAPARRIAATWRMVHAPIASVRELPRAFAAHALDWSDSTPNRSPDRVSS
jgi:hypothetical protein